MNKIKCFKEGWIETFGGNRYDILDPDAESIDIRDIAHALSMQCRYNGNTREFYSVAEHSVLVARHIHRRFKNPLLSMTALLHDAHEAFVGDLVGPMKSFLPEFEALEAISMRAIGSKFDLIHPLPVAITHADRRILVDERAQAMSRSDNDWGLGLTVPLGVDLEFLPPHVARKKFLTYYHALRKLRDKGF